jgi:energy-coupling factor transport system ATP-binding protein
VWLPTSTLAALRLRRAGFVLDPLPLTPTELHAALEVEPSGAERRPFRPATADAAPQGPDPGNLPALRGERGAGPLIRVRGLTLRRGRTEVLHDIDLDIAAGEFVAVVGANGAGKTSLVQALAGVVRPPRGTVTVDGLDVHRTDPRTLAAHVGFVFQNPEHQFVAHTVFDELAHGLRRQRLADEEVRRRVDDLLERFGLTRHAQSHPFLLSGGQKRRLSVGTALVGGARTLVLDEPTFGQDRARAEELLSLLDALHAEGTTVVVVTHDMQLVTDHAERTVVVADGRIVADVATAAVFADDALLERASLRPPPLRRALRGLTQHPSFSTITRLADLPGGDR